jgi:hypothetical protein
MAVGTLRFVLPASHRRFPNLAFAPVPPGEDIVLDLALAGAGSISVEFTPGYRRAW